MHHRTIKPLPIFIEMCSHTVQTDAIKLQYPNPVVMQQQQQQWQWWICQRLQTVRDDVDYTEHQKSNAKWLIKCISPSFTNHHTHTHTLFLSVTCGLLTIEGF